MKEVDAFTKQFTDETLSDVIQLKRNFFRVSPELLKIKERISTQPFAIGTFIGSGKPFHPSTALLDWIGERTNRYVTIDRKSAWLFLCGRDVFAKSILEKNVDKGLVIVKNSDNEVLGYGNLLMNRQVAIKNILDKGDFIRREHR